MSKRVYLLGVGVVLVVFAFLLMDWLLWEPGVTEANVRRVLPGMTFPMVKAILGPPARGSADLAPGFTQTLSWGGEDGDVVITFSKDGGVAVKLFIPAPTRLRRLAPLRRFHAWFGW
ncbi:MAG: hypothetical protein L0Z62_30445 [Gemmataceae bacterium]|nr:hypothetical protein [Gemmataceae bacterium]